MKIIRKIFLISSAFVLLAAGCNQQPTNPTPAMSPVAQQPAPAPSPTPVAPTPAPQPNQAKQGTYTVYETVEGSTINKPSYLIVQDLSAYDLLKATHVVEAKDYGSMGMFVTGIDGVKPDSKHFWKFYLNGKSSNIGASSYKLKKDDKVEWKLDLISSGD